MHEQVILMIIWMQTELIELVCVECLVLTTVSLGNSCESSEIHVFIFMGD